MILMNNHKQKMKAPIVITVIIILYYVIYFGVLIALIDGAFKYLLGIIPLIIALLLIKVCVERINEIKKGDEDDIGKY